MNVFSLKIIAILTMMIDHYGVIFYKGVDIYRIIGRIAFPIYCFLLVEGYFHTKDIKKYANRLFIFALISEIPFDWAFYGEINFKHQNIFFTLLIGLGTMYLLDNLDKYKTKEIFVCFLAGIISMIVSVDYSIVGIIYILTFYYTRNYPKTIRLSRTALVLFVTNLLTLSFNQHFALLSLPILYLYNEELGPKNKVLQILFYIAYPLHLMVYYFIKSIWF